MDKIEEIEQRLKAVENKIKVWEEKMVLEMEMKKFRKSEIMRGEHELERMKQMIRGR
jgi:membrane protein insertase Oxa1/YidC/SpoIIIJ